MRTSLGKMAYIWSFFITGKAGPWTLHTLRTKKYRLLKKSQDQILQAELKCQKIEDGGGPLYQAPTREHVYHPTMESLPIKKKVARVSTRYINKLERRVNIYNYLHPSFVQVTKSPHHCLLPVLRVKKGCPQPKRVLAKRTRDSES